MTSMSVQTQHEFEKDPIRGFEKWRNYDNLPEGFKQFLKRENDFTVDSSELTNGVPYTYKVKYWSSSDTFSVIRWPKKTGSTSWKKPQNEYTFGRVEQGNEADINEIAAMGKTTNEKWKYEGFAVVKTVSNNILQDQIVHIITRQDKVNVPQTDQNQ